MDNACSLGIRELDSQHDEIDSVVKSLADALDEGQSSQQIHSILVRLGELLRFHFSVEESVMQIVSYPFVLEHQAAHKKILHELEEFKRVARKKGKLEGIDVSVRAAFNHDVIKHDKVFIEFIRTHWESLMH